MKLKSFGCSFVYGSDLSDPRDMAESSDHTWPALAARTLGLDYECHAWPGVGNFRILCDIISQASLNDPAVFVINWTWIDRFDFVDDQEQWQTIRPGQTCARSDMYYRYFHSQIKDMMSSVYNINTAIALLQEQQIPFAMTYMDYSMLDVVNPNWHDPKYLSVVQKRIKDVLVDFEGKNFLDWSREKGFPISKAWHPLEEAHAAAADLMLPVIDAILRRA